MSAHRSQSFSLPLPCLDGVGIIVIIFSIWSKVDVPGNNGFPAMNTKCLWTLLLINHELCMCTCRINQFKMISTYLIAFLLKYIQVTTYQHPLCIWWENTSTLTAEKTASNWTQPAGEIFHWLAFPYSFCQLIWLCISTCLINFS